ncbi:MAG: L,D-transpeptidase family protein, partial [Terriglobia bacterium]
MTPLAVAQDDQAAQQADDPSGDSTNPADQDAAPDDAAPAPDQSTEAAAPADDSGQATPGEQPSVTPVQTVETPAAATPIVASIRAKLNDPTVRKDAPTEDLAVLEAFYNARSEALWMTDMGFSNEAQAAIDEIRKADDWGLSSAAFDLPSAGDLPGSVEEQAVGEIELNLAILKYARHARGGRTNPVQLSKLYGMTPTLRDPKIVMTEIAAADAPDAYLRSLHPKHEQFRRLHEALLKARAEAEAGAKPRDVQRIVINMERWRWMPEDLGSVYVWLNVPSFMVRVVKDGNSVYSDKIVVGELKYATPMFSADLKSVVFNPEWTVPPTIVRENLLPALRGGGGLFGSNTSILTQHDLNVNYNGKRVDPSSIDWNHVNMGAISFTQAPGPTNVLGKVKFVYPNPYSVYMHDTIKEGLFDKVSRAEGHNCPRVANPGKIAAVILAQDQNMPQAEVDKLLASGSNSSISISHRVRVLTTYFTAMVNDEGKVETFADVYRLDGGVASAILGKSATPEAVADNVDPKPSQPPEADPAPTAAVPSSPHRPQTEGFAGAAP